MSNVWPGQFGAFVILSSSWPWLSLLKAMQRVANTL